MLSCPGPAPLTTAASEALLSYSRYLNWGRQGYLI